MFLGESTNQKGMSEFLKLETASSLVLQCSGEQNFANFLGIFFSVKYLKTVPKKFLIYI